MKTIKASEFFKSMVASGEMHELESGSDRQIQAIDASGTGFGLVFMLDHIDKVDSNGANGQTELEVVSVPVFKFKGEFYTFNDADSSDILRTMIRMTVSSIVS